MGNDQVFEGSAWRQIEDGNYSSISKVEVQVWLTLYNILSKSICTEKYEINDYRKGVLTKLVNQISPAHISTLPLLSSFKKWLLQLSISNVSSSGTGLGGGGMGSKSGGMGSNQPSMKANFMIEAVAQLRDTMIHKYDKRWDQIARDQSALFLGDCAAEMATEVDRLFRAFDSEAAQTLLSKAGSNLKTDKTKAEVDDVILTTNGKRNASHHSPTSGTEEKTSCALCSTPNAKQRCSRCRSERYCGRDCQVKHWPYHKKQCK